MTEYPRNNKGAASRWGQRKQGGQRGQQGQQGMTLLEVLVVLVIIGIVAATVSPPMARVVESVRFKTEADAVAEQIRNLRIAALLEQQDITLTARASDDPYGINDGDQASDSRNNSLTGGGDSGPDRGLISDDGPSDVRSVVLLEGWVLDGDDLVFLKNGICLGGEVVLRAPTGRAKTMIFDAPDCKMGQSSVR